MANEIGSFHSILKNKTRRQIVRLLNEKGNLSYTGLLDELGSSSTGQLNYHLKVLGDLVSKGQDGSYHLTEKGNVAFQFLEAVPKENSYQKRNDWEHKFWKAISISFVASLVITIALYLLGLISLSSFFQSLLWIFPAISAVFVIEYIFREGASKKIQPKYRNANYYPRGIVVGFLMWLALIFGLFLSGLSRKISLLGT